MVGSCAQDDRVGLPCLTTDCGCAHGHLAAVQVLGFLVEDVAIGSSTSSIKAEFLECAIGQTLGLEGVRRDKGRATRGLAGSRPIESTGGREESAPIGLGEDREDHCLEQESWRASALCFAPLA